MRTFLGIVRYEYRMGVRRWGTWLAFALASLPYTLSFADFHGAWEGWGTNTWHLAGSAGLTFNVLMPVVGGIAMADRLERDWRLGVHELLQATPLARGTYVLGKYVGAVLAVLTPVFVAWLVELAGLLATGAPASIVLPWPLVFLAVIVPAYAFVGAFSLACPAVLPVRVYQVLFTGYWFWGNFLSPDFLPTVNGTLLTASGIFAAGGFFSSSNIPAQPVHTTVEAVLNLAVLAACAAVALVTLDRYLAWQAKRA